MAVTDLPLPDSPTRPMISPSPTSRLQSRTAFTVRPNSGKSTLSPDMDSSVWLT